MSKITLLLVDDHGVVRYGLRALLSNEPDFEIIGEATSGREAIARAQELKPDIIVMDLAMPLLNGTEATRQIIAGCPSAKIIVLSGYTDAEHVERVIAEGAAAYLLKHTAGDDLIRAIREVRNGNSFFSPAVASLLSAKRISDLEHAKSTPPAPRLTMRESEVVQLIAEGFLTKQIADELKISVKTIEKHRQSAMQKLNLHCIADLVRHAAATGIIQAPSSRTILN
ncbi:MAG: response regulator transcription factor [Akkermansiaceae bacterium]|nr:response regulator transcription factor [Verrucomicrobiales bacterium]